MESGRRRLRSCFAHMSPGGPGSPSVLIMKDCPCVGLDAGRMKTAKAVGSRGRMPLSVPGRMVPRPKIAAVERRKACALSHKRALLCRLHGRSY